MKALVGTFNQEKALVWAFSLIAKASPMVRFQLYSRLRVPSGLNMTEDMAAEFASQVQCPHLVVKAAQGPRYMSAEVYTRLREVFRKYNPNFVYRELAGGHHLHLNTPEAVAPVINKFLAQKFDTSANLDEEHKPQFDL